MSKSRDLGEFPAAALDIDASGNVNLTGDVSLADNDKLLLGDGDDLQIYHDGGNSYIDDVGTGDLVIRGSSAVYIQKYAGENMIKASADAGVQVFHNNSEKLTTTSTGIDVTGTVTADGLVVDGDGTFSGRVSIATAPKTWTMDFIQLGLNAALAEDSNSVYLAANAYNNAGWKRTNAQSAGYVRMGTNDGIFSFSNAATGAADSAIAWSERVRINSSGNLGIGTSSPAAELQVSGGTQGIIISQSDAARDLGYYAQIKAPYADKSFELNVNNKKLITAGGYMHATSLMFHTDDIERVRIDGSGNLLVGTTTVPASGNTTGFRVDESGYISLTGAGTSAIDANRMGSDGPVINIRKDGTTSGNIGVSASGTEVYLAGSGGNTSGIFCSNGNALLSMKAGVLANGTQDLGSPSYRFNDLYLAGSIQSSGGATNILGTTTVFSASNFSITTSAQTVVPQSAIPTLPTGVYLMTIYLSGGGWYSGYVSGLVQHYASTTNSSAGGGPNTIHLTAGGHALNSGVLYARYQTTLGNDNQHGVQIWSSVATTVNSITISWKRLS